jgi:anaerobic selenocysteine-containing dehydrogenase
MGFEDECFRDSDDQMMDAALASPNPWLRGITRARLEDQGHIRLNFPKSLSRSSSQFSVPGSQFFLPFADGNFPTSSGKALLYNESLKALGLDPLVEFTPASESRHGIQARAFPLELLARKADNFLNSSFSNIPVVREMEEAGVLDMNRVDAQPRGIADGDTVRVFNDRGHVLLRARVNGTVQPGVVSARLQWAKLAAGGRNVNVLTSEKLTDLGNSATFYSVLVEVELSGPAS